MIIKNSYLKTDNNTAVLRIVLFHLAVDHFTENSRPLTKNSRPLY